MKTFIKWTLNILSIIGWIFFGIMMYGLALCAFWYTGTRQLSGDYEYYEEHKFIQGAAGKGYIPPSILGYHSNDDYITARQLPKPHPTEVEDGTFYPDGRDRVYYWLIIVPEERTIGPLTREQFNDSLEQYHVPGDLDFY